MPGSARHGACCSAAHDAQRPRRPTARYRPHCSRAGARVRAPRTSRRMRGRRRLRSRLRLRRVRGAIVGKRRCELGRCFRQQWEQRWRLRRHGRIREWDGRMGGTGSGVPAPPPEYCGDGICQVANEWCRQLSRGLRAYSCAPRPRACRAWTARTATSASSSHLPGRAASASSRSAATSVHRSRGRDELPGGLRLQGAVRAASRRLLRGHRLSRRLLLPLHGLRSRPLQRQWWCGHGRRVRHEPARRPQAGVGGTGSGGSSSRRGPGRRSRRRGLELHRGSARDLHAARERRGRQHRHRRARHRRYRHGCGRNGRHLGHRRARRHRPEHGWRLRDRRLPGGGCGAGGTSSGGTGQGVGGTGGSGTGGTGGTGTGATSGASTGGASGGTQGTSHDVVTHAGCSVSESSESSSSSSFGGLALARSGARPVVAGYSASRAAMRAAL